MIYNSKTIITQSKANRRSTNGWQRRRRAKTDLGASQRTLRLDRNVPLDRGAELRIMHIRREQETLVRRSRDRLRLRRIEFASNWLAKLCYATASQQLSLRRAQANYIHRK